MNIAIDTSATKVTQAGCTTYIRELLCALRNIDNNNQYTELEYVPKFKRDRFFLRKFDTFYREIIWTQRKLLELARQKRADILHSPVPLAPLRCTIPLIVTIHDLYTFKDPGSFPMWHQRSDRFLFPKVVERSDKIIAVSNFTRNEILDFLPNISEDKIAVIHEGVHKRFKVIRDKKLSTIKQKYFIKKPFILSVATIEPRKNIERLFKAFTIIKDKIEHDLILVGPYGWKSKVLYTLIKDLKIASRVRFLGYVDINDLPYLYNLADIFIYPSLYEGFGFPPLEAMACSCPVITSNTSSLVEIAGDAAYTVNPFNVEEISNAVLHVSQNMESRNILKAKGLERVKMFTWENCAKKTLSVYSSVIN